MWNGEEIERAARIDKFEVTREEIELPKRYDCILPSVYETGLFPHTLSVPFLLATAAGSLPGGGIGKRMCNGILPGVKATDVWAEMAKIQEQINSESYGEWREQILHTNPRLMNMDQRTFEESFEEYWERAK